MRHRTACTPRALLRAGNESNVVDRIAQPEGPLADPPALPKPPATQELVALDPIDPLPHKLERDHAHYRQRTLHAVDRARSKLVSSALRGASGGRGRSKQEPAEEHKHDYDEYPFWADVWAGGAEPEHVDAGGMRGQRKGERQSGTEVRLADLVKPSRASKSKAALRLSKDNDFEVIPYVRSVIVLDDFDTSGAPEIELNLEAWEHVSSDGSEDDPKTVLSYAEVAACKV